MKIIIQRVSHASVVVNEEVVGSIEKGLLVLLGIGHDDSQADANKLIDKLLALRIFNDDAGKMNLSITDIHGALLVISQFTLHADCRKGNRLSFTDAAPPSIAIPLYEYFIQTLRVQYNGKVETGVFGADMKVSLLNDGPVTISLDSKIWLKGANESA